MILTPNMTNTSEKLYAIVDKLEDTLIQHDRTEHEKEQELIYMQKYGLIKPSIDRMTLVVTCEDYGINGTDCMTNEEMIDALMKLPPGTRTVFEVVTPEKAMKILYARELLNKIGAYLKTEDKDRMEAVTTFQASKTTVA